MIVVIISKKQRNHVQRPLDLLKFRHWRLVTLDSEHAHITQLSETCVGPSRPLAWVRRRGQLGLSFSARNVRDSRLYGAMDRKLDR